MRARGLRSPWAGTVVMIDLRLPTGPLTTSTTRLSPPSPPPCPPPLPALSPAPNRPGGRTARFLILSLMTYPVTTVSRRSPPAPRAPFARPAPSGRNSSTASITPLKRATRGPSRLWTPRFRERRRVDPGPFPGARKNSGWYLKFYMGSFNQPRSSPNDEPSKGSTTNVQARLCTVDSGSAVLVRSG